MNAVMQFDVIAAIIGATGLLAFLVGFKLLASSSWVLGWLRGNIGIACLVLTGVIATSVMDVRTYRPMFTDKAIATLTFRQKSPGEYT